MTKFKNLVILQLRNGRFLIVIFNYKISGS